MSKSRARNLADALISPPGKQPISQVAPASPTRAVVDHHSIGGRLRHSRKQQDSEELQSQEMDEAAVEDFEVVLPASRPQEATMLGKRTAAQARRQQPASAAAKQQKNEEQLINNPASESYDSQVSGEEEDGESESLTGQSNDDTFACPEKGCEKVFSRKIRLNAHMHLHYGTQPFRCTFPKCMKAFSEKQNLKIHQRIHKDERPFPCLQGCGKSFRTKGNMRDHERRHFGLKPFVCHKCGVRYYRKNVLKAHLSKCQVVGRSKPQNNMSHKTFYLDHDVDLRDKINDVRSQQAVKRCFGDITAVPAKKVNLKGANSPKSAISDIEHVRPSQSDCEPEKLKMQVFADCASQSSKKAASCQVQSRSPSPAKKLPEVVTVAVNPPNSNWMQGILTNVMDQDQNETLADQLRLSSSTMESQLMQIILLKRTILGIYGTLIEEKEAERFAKNPFALGSVALLGAMAMGSTSQLPLAANGHHQPTPPKNEQGARKLRSSTLRLTPPPKDDKSGRVGLKAIKNAKK